MPPPGRGLRLVRQASRHPHCHEALPSTHFRRLLSARFSSPAAVPVRVVPTAKYRLRLKGCIAIRRAGAIDAERSSASLTHPEESSLSKRERINAFRFQLCRYISHCSESVGRVLGRRRCQPSSKRAVTKSTNRRTLGELPAPLGYMTCTGCPGGDLAFASASRIDCCALAKVSMTSSS